MIIRGLDSSGFLKTKSANGDVVLLQPDGNTFDMLKNLISVKESHVF
jgi:biotin--protein ligase